MESQNSNFHNLSKQHIQVFMFLAYVINPIKKTDLESYFFKLYKMQALTVKGIVTDLELEGLVQIRKARSYWDNDVVSIKREWIYDAMRLLLTEYTECEKKFRSAFSRRDPDAVLRAEYYFIFRSIFDGVNMDIEMKDDDIVFLGDIFMDVYPKHPEVLQFLPASLLRCVVAKLVSRSINDDSGDGMGALIGMLLEKVDLRRLSPSAWHLLQLGFVVQTGHRYEGICMNGHSCYVDLIDMLEALERSDYGAAVAAYDKALECDVEDWDSWVDPQSLPLFMMLHGVAVYMANGQKSIGLKRAVASDLEEGNDDCDWALRVFVKSFDNSKGTAPVEDICRLFDSAAEVGWINQKLGQMLSVWQGVSYEQIVRGVKNKKLCDSKNIEYYAHATKLADELLQAIPMKQQWERTLEMIIEQEGQITGRHNDVDDSKRTKRLAYFMTRRYVIEVREQARLKSGRWGAGKKVSETRLCYMNESYMDDVDMRVQELFKSRMYNGTVSVSDLLPLLRGCNKVYYGYCAPYAICEVVEDKPFITAHVGDNGISVSTNLPVGELSDMDGTRLLIGYKEVGKTMSGKDAEPCGIISYYTVPVRLRQYIKALVAVGTFPLSAEPRLKQVFDQIKGLVEIHSEMIEGGSTLPQVEGRSGVIIRIVPSGGMYDVRAVVRPLENGSQTVLPGRGDSNVYDQGKDNVRYQVIRDKKQERQNAKALRDYMETADAYEQSAYVWTLDPYALLELMEWIPEQGNDYTVEWPEGEKIKLSTPNPSKWNISLKEKAGWFDVEGTLPIDEQTVLSIGQLFDLMSEGQGRFIKLEDGQYLRLTEGLRRQLQRIDSVANNVRGKMKISALGAGLIADYLDGDIVIDHPKKIDDLRKRIRQSEDIQAEIPDELNATLRDYQTDGVQWMNRLTSWGAGACLADDMGLGKTVQSITFLLQKKEEGPSMVVAPASVVPNWKKELDRFAPTLNVSVLNDLSSDDRKTAVEQAAACDVILTTYGLLISAEETLVKKQWNVVCLDEAHSIKNASTKTSGVCMQLKASKRLILTGTPIQNHLGELWNLFSFINPGLLGSYEQFAKKYINPIEGAHDKERQQQLRRIIQPFMLRRTKKEVVKELPDKQEITIPVELSNEELAIYELIRMEAKAQLEEDANGNGAASVNALAMITKLRMASCSASLVQKKWDGISAKLSTFVDLVTEICTAGNRVLVFSQFTSFLEMAKHQLESQGIKDYLYLDGSTPIKKRTEMVEQFQSGKSQLFLISLKAGGLGLNLTGANYVIHLDPWWNPAIEQQATDRAYRIGQQQKVTVYHLISEHTIEEKIVRLHQTKRDLADSLLDGTDMSHKLSAKDLLDMLQMDM